MLCFSFPVKKMYFVPTVQLSGLPEAAYFKLTKLYFVNKLQQNLTETKLKGHQSLLVRL